MKPKMYSRQSNSLLHDHILDGHFASHDGIEQLYAKALITEKEYLQLVRKNILRLRQRIREFRLAEKITCIVFALALSWLQATGTDLEMRRARNARRRNEHTLTLL